MTNVEQSVVHESGHACSRPVSGEAYKAAFRRHPGGVAVITADPGDGPVGLTATSVTSVSLDPPLVLFSVSHRSSSSPSLLRSEHMMIHLIEAADLPIARLCATSGIDRFADTSMWERLPTGEPYFLGVDNWLRCCVVKQVEVGGATIIIAEVLELGDITTLEEPAPLVYHDRAWYRLDEARRL